MTVAILGDTSDEQVTAVMDGLSDLGVELTVWNPDEWPGKTPLSFAQRADGQRIVMDAPVDPAEIDAVYLRRLDLDPRAGEMGEQFEQRPNAVLNQIREYQGLVKSILRTLEARGVPVVNPESASRLHSQKPYQLSMFADAGVPVPETLCTNDPEAAAEFVRAVDDAIFKPIGGGGHARPIDASELHADRLSKLANSPVQFQERLDGDTLRLFVVGGEVVACGRIESDALDYRDSEHRIDSHEPSAAVADAAVTAAETLGLRFSGVDVIVDDDGFGVLEANPSPMFAEFDRRAGTDVATHLVQYLASQS